MRPAFRIALVVAALLGVGLLIRFSPVGELLRRSPAEAATAFREWGADSLLLFGAVMALPMIGGCPRVPPSAVAGLLFGFRRGLAVAAGA